MREVERKREGGLREMIRREIEATSSSLDTCSVPERGRMRKTERGGEGKTRAYHHHRHRLYGDHGGESTHHGAGFISVV